MAKRPAAMKFTVTPLDSAGRPDAGAFHHLDIEGDVPEVSVGDTELAVSATATVVEPVGGATYPVRITRIRYDGQLFRPVTPTAKEAPGSLLPNRLLSRLQQSGMWAVTSGRKLLPPGERRPDMALAARVEGMMKETLQRDFFKSDGVLYERAGPPFVSVKHPIYPAHNQGGPRMGHSILSLEDGSETEPGHYAFSLTRGDDALKFAQEFANIDKHDQRLLDLKLTRLTVDRFEGDDLLINEKGINAAAALRMMLNTMKEVADRMPAGEIGRIVEMCRLRDLALAGDEDAAGVLIRQMRQMSDEDFLVPDITDTRIRRMNKAVTIGVAALTMSRSVGAPAATAGFRP
ncbi:hypothetical protein [Bosea sp. RAC05]|uniref:hypothetical protein n=1 Tax=Bosea sp. RAC05 TaxID=1842539 RepID=UPI000858FEBA|nr:hypothetical protein [Bosea sp. RAC05]AOG03397.1 hypothetical protein BSY19_4758 [Bosea sp. RAC05]